MKKRILLIMALGLSFTPSVFAGLHDDDELRSYSRRQLRTGEEDIESALATGGGVGCNLRNKKGSSDISSDSDHESRESGRQSRAKSLRE